MKTTSYNPSIIEQAFAQAFVQVKDQLQQALGQYQITELTPRLQKDNPDVVVKLTDSDGDPHELVVTFIQRPD